MCINLFTNSVGHILLVLYLSKHYKFRLYIYNSKCIVQDTKKVSYYVMYF